MSVNKSIQTLIRQKFHADLITVKFATSPCLSWLISKQKKNQGYFLIRHPCRFLKLVVDGQDTLEKFYSFGITESFAIWRAQGWFINDHGNYSPPNIYWAPTTVTYTAETNSIFDICPPSAVKPHNSILPSETLQDWLKPHVPASGSTGEN